MKRAIALLLLSTIYISSSNFGTEGKVYVLNAKNAETFVDEREYALIYGYVPNCDTCATFEGFMQKLAERLNRLGNVKIGKIDIQNNMDVQKLLNARYLPHIALFVNGVYKQYEGEIIEDNIYKWVNNIVSERPNVIKISTIVELEEYLANELAVGLKHKDSDIDSLKILESFSKLYPKIKFYRLINDAAKDIKDNFNLTIVRKFDEKNKVLSGDNVPSKRVIQQFFDMFKSPYVLTLNEPLIQETYKTHRPTVFFFDKEYNGKLIKSLNSELFQLKQKITLVQSNLSEGGSEQVAALFGANKSNLPIMGIFDFKDGNMRKYKLDNKFTPSKFIEKYFEQNLPEYYNSEPIPTEHDGIEFVVRDNFDAVVKDRSKHVVVGIVSDTCSYCKEVHESFAKAAKKLKEGNEDIKFVKLNLDRNDVDVRVQGMPSIKLYKKNDKSNPVDYPLIRDWEVLLEWLEKEIDRQSIFSKPIPEQYKPKQPVAPEGYDLKTAEEYQNTQEL